MAKLNQIFAKVLIIIIKFYRFAISPLLGPRCRFHPSCSAYALEAIKLHGFWVGSNYMIRRLLRCHPFSKKWGFDPVPCCQQRDPKDG